MTNTYAPILLFVYNRPEHVRRNIQALLKNELAAESELFIYSDAAKDETSQATVKEVRAFIRSIQGFKKITITERTENWGLARSIIDGVTTLINRYGRVIVLEDDLVVAPHFLQFMNDALETYRDEERVGHIQACDFTHDPSLPDTFLIKWTGSWGWATWDRAWKHFNADGKALLTELESRKLTYTFDFNGKYGYTRMLRRQIEGKNNSWAIRWNASLFLKDILSLNVGKSLVQNEGFDGSGTNCGGGGLYASELYMERLPVKKISPIEENIQARNAYVRYYARTNSFMAKAIRRIKRTLKGDFGA
ncbi:MAG: glycosyltransferase [Bacteroides sp.]|nr:glycosyltransferase [Bacteroides sp.]